MSVVNNQNNREYLISGVLLCIFYVAFIAFVAASNSSADWQEYGYNEYYENGPKSPDMRFVSMVTGVALLYVIPWIVYFLNRRARNYISTCGGVYAVFTILLVICHFITFFPPYEVIHNAEYGPSSEYRVYEKDSVIRLLAGLFFMFGTIIYVIVSITMSIIMSIIMLIKIKRDKDNTARAEKIAQLFNYPYPERREKVKELWGETASEYAGTVCFPPKTPWQEIVAVIKQTGKKQCAYVTLQDEDFGVITHEDITNNEDASLALVSWWKEVKNSNQPIQLDFELYDDKTLICHVCTKEGYRGDEDGFGVEPDMWASSLFDFEGNVIGPFRPGYTYKL